MVGAVDELADFARRYLERLKTLSERVQSKLDKPPCSCEAGKARAQKNLLCEVIDAFNEELGRGD